MKNARKLTVFGAAIFALTFGAGNPIQAADCYYRGYQDGHGVLGDIQGIGHAIKYENACDRARRECNRRLDRARK